MVHRTNNRTSVVGSGYENGKEAAVLTVDNTFT